MSILDTVVDRGYYGFADNDMGRVAVHKAIQELAELRATVAALHGDVIAANNVAELAIKREAELKATVAALTAERDAAYRLGWDDAREAAASVPVDFASYAENRDLSGGYSCREVENAIRALQPPTALTEHDADKKDSCGLCKNFKRCESLFGCKPDDTECDWSPSRFERA